MAGVRRVEVLHCRRDHCLPRNCSLAFRRMEAWVASRSIRPMAHLRHLRPLEEAVGVRQIFESQTHILNLRWSGPFLPGWPQRLLQ